MSVINVDTAQWGSGPIISSTESGSMSHRYIRSVKNQRRNWGDHWDDINPHPPDCVTKEMSSPLPTVWYSSWSWRYFSFKKKISGMVRESYSNQSKSHAGCFPSRKLSGFECQLKTQFASYRDHALWSNSPLQVYNQSMHCCCSVLHWKSCLRCRNCRVSMLAWVWFSVFQIKQWTNRLISMVHFI